MKARDMYLALTGRSTAFIWFGGSFDFSGSVVKHWGFAPYQLPASNAIAASLQEAGFSYERYGLGDVDYETHRRVMHMTSYHETPWTRRHIVHTPVAKGVARLYVWERFVDDLISFRDRHVTITGDDADLFEGVGIAGTPQERYDAIQAKMDEMSSQLLQTRIALY